MIKKYEEKSGVLLLEVMTIIIAIALLGLTSCSSKKPLKENNSNNGKIIQKSTVKNDETKGSKQDTSNEQATVNSESANAAKSDSEKNSFVKYLSLLGLSKEKLISAMNENPISIDEGGLEFKQAGIRVWFDQKSNTLVEQVFIMRKDIDFNGVRIGDNFSKFKEVFGNTVSDKNGDAHFKYNNIFLSVNYDTSTEQTFAVYILKNDF